MGTLLQENVILDDLKNACKNQLGMDILSAEPIRRGWLNLKWRIHTKDGVFLLKQYNKERLKKYSIPALQRIFAEQNNLHRQGFPCPKIIANQDNLFLESPLGERFMVMEYCSGKTVEPGKLSNAELYELGYYTGKLHALWEELPLAPQTTFQPPKTSLRIAYWEKVIEAAKNMGKSHLLPILEKQLRLTKSFPLENLNLDAVGWSHRDLWVDNLLFDQGKLTAILDFDRMNYDFPQLDVARAIISGALNEDKLNVQGAFAFLNGYRFYHSIGSDFLPNALKLLWYMESEWWLDTELDARKGPPKRFVQEMVWLSDHLHELDTILGNYEGG
ncbi:phosphotransferase [Ornithinibacillus xuwenensis]|uniref:Phosphotransferase n=1 Tax=Ornithinibacillus xuwenensis TaxID=3144668 RepID=A0ABU9XJ15_9BACI